jgi:electron transfer flavoprotein alpha subunit
MKAGLETIWILIQPERKPTDDLTLGLLAEARRLLCRLGTAGRVVAVGTGTDSDNDLSELGAYGADSVIYVRDETLTRYQGELSSEVIHKLLREYKPTYLLMGHTPETADLAPRLAAALESALVTRAMDLGVGPEGEAYAVRPVSNGYLFEEVHFPNDRRPHIVSFVPGVLTPEEPGAGGDIEIRIESIEVSVEGLKTRLVEVREADPGSLALEDADIIVAGGRGMGRGESFEPVYELARTIGGSVGGTRPVIDWKVLPFELQIGQTGKTVTPRLIFNCGISGANEYTAGMERSQLVIAVNTDPQARIFRFADLGVIADVHELLSALIKRLKELKASQDDAEV